MLNNILYILFNYGSALEVGLRHTIIITVTSYFTGLVVGLLIAVLRVYGGRWIRGVLGILVEIIRGTPMMVQLFFVYYALPEIGLLLNPVAASIIAIAINSAVYQSEYIRASISAIPYSQFESALSIGLTKSRAVLTIILPQAIRVATPALVNEAVYLFKYSSIAYFVTAPELMYIGKFIGSRTFLYVEMYIVLAAIYVATSIVLTELAKVIERRYVIPGLLKSKA
ncbi:MAG: amino acid ABC transporter permease [Ignisphaera sp.]|nr:amino acid ABC transporter permease [Ignisphaera sp.]MCX8167457.1 amino acid ABC transporter permease [Ignisphaera sp.]MDW8084679.1 amino acid ABC transporter permease [Ignisphaera sp.]